MYRLNLLPRTVLITTDEVIALGPTDSNPDPRNLLNAIQIAEERFIKPALGRALYNDLRSQKNTLVASGNKDELTSKVNYGNTGQIIAINEGDIINAVELIENEDYVELWNEQLWKLVAECVVYIATPTNYSKHTASGEMVTNPKSISNEGSGSNSVDLPDVKWKLDQLLQNRIEPLVASLKEYLCENRAKFPLYQGDCGKREMDGISISGKTGWVNAYSRNSRRDRERFDPARDWDRD